MFPAPFFRRSARALLLTLGLATGATAADLSPATHPLAAALSLAGPLRTGAEGTFDAQVFCQFLAPDGRPTLRPKSAQGTGDARWQDGFGAPNGPNGEVMAACWAGNDLYVAGYFTRVGTVVAYGVARWDGIAWHSLGTGAANGLLGNVPYVRALAVASNGDVYAGGSFTLAGGAPANAVARWDGRAWHPVGTGLTGGVNALAIGPNGDLYAGGYFARAGGNPAANVARWNGTTWQALGTGTANGVDQEVRAVAVSAAGDVYVGGGFAQAGGTPATGVARWNGTAWSALGSAGAEGVNGFGVATLAVNSAGEVYVGGRFTQAGTTAANNVARWNGTTWTTLGAGPANGLNGYVAVLRVAASGEVYAGGNFTQAGGAAAASIAHWNGTAWRNLGAGATGSYNNAVGALALAPTGDVYAGGSLLQAGGAAAHHLARWNGTAWQALGTGTTNGVGDAYDFVDAVAVAPNGDVYVSGAFFQAGGVVAQGVARWNGTTWSGLGPGTPFGAVFALAVAPNGDVYAGGDFYWAGGAAVNHVARWNGTAWQALGTGAAEGVNGRVNALAIAGNGDLYVGGNFSQAGGTPALNVARWDGTSWSGLGTGVGGGSGPRVLSLAVAAGGVVYAGGEFAQAGGVSANNVARWNGTTWSSLGSGAANGVSGWVNALAVAGNGQVYAGGLELLGTATSGVARWDGTTWSALGTGPNAALNVAALALASNGNVYAGGYSAPASQPRSVACWTGAAWTALGTGLNGGVNALALGTTGKLYVGGRFDATGDSSKIMDHFGIYDPNAPLAAAPAIPVAAALFPNPAHHAATLRLPADASRWPLVLLDAQGRAVRHYPAPVGHEVPLDLHGLPAGVYLLRSGQLVQRLMLE